MNRTGDIIITEIESIKTQIGAEHDFDVRSLFALLEQLPPRNENPLSARESKPVSQLISEPAA